MCNTKKHDFQFHRVPASRCVGTLRNACRNEVPDPNLFVLITFIFSHQQHLMSTWCIMHFCMYRNIVQQWESLFHFTKVCTCTNMFGSKNHDYIQDFFYKRFLVLQKIFVVLRNLWLDRSKSQTHTWNTIHCRNSELQRTWLFLQGSQKGRNLNWTAFRLVRQTKNCEKRNNYFNTERANFLTSRIFSFSASKCNAKQHSRGRKARTRGSPPARDFPPRRR